MKMNRSVVPEKAFKGHSRSSAVSSFVRSPDCLLETAKVGYSYFETKVAEMKVHQGQC